MKDLYTFALIQMNIDSMKSANVKHTKKKFKIGDLEFLVDAFHPLKFEKGVYAVSICAKHKINQRKRS